jgi:8-oxo-dGTP diphosphatase
MTETARGQEIQRIIIPSAQVMLLREGEHGFEIFLGKRTSTAFNGQWAFIGGKQDPGETPEETALRELQEEVGLTLNKDQLVFFRDAISISHKEVEGRQVARHYHLKTFVVDAKGLNPRNTAGTEHSDMQWMSLEQALAMHAIALENNPGVDSANIPGALAPRCAESIEYLMGLREQP